MKKISTLVFLSALVIAATAQTNDSVTIKDYTRAASFLLFNTNQFVDNNVTAPNWLPGDKFWYRKLTAQGSEFILVDAAKGTRSAAFDQQRLATLLSDDTKQTYKPF